MNLPMVFPANRRTTARELDSTFPGRLGLFFGPKAFRPPVGLPYCLDNGRFVVWDKGQKWDEDGFWELIDKAKRVSYHPLWIAVPDVVADADSTFKEWKKWHRPMSRLSWPLALVVQDGMNPSDVLTLRPSPDVIFVGGSSKWKWWTLPLWTKKFPRVHVGRVNTGRKLWAVHRARAESSDGTGWMYDGQYKQLREYLRESSSGIVMGRGLFS